MPNSSSRRFAVLATLVCVFVLAPEPTMAQGKRPAKKAPPKKPVTKVPKGPGNVQQLWQGVAKVKSDPDSLAAVKAASGRIDQLVNRSLARLELLPNPKTNDAQFVRRIYLDITGTIPTPHQTQSFLASRRPDKREILIDHLLGSPGYVSHSFNYWANVMRLVDRPTNRVNVVVFHQWLKNAIRRNMPYDKMVYAMLSAEGHLWDNPAVGYWMRDSNMPLDSINNTVRVFLGTQIGCAQCHDHPFDKWSQRQFYEMAAFTYGVSYRKSSKDTGGNPVTRLREQLKKIDPDHRGGGSFLRVIQANQEYISDINRKLRLPHDYQYLDGEPKDLIEPKFLFGKSPPKSGSLRNQFATWMTSPENPRFAMSMANRLWARTMGVGLIDPVDDIRDDSAIENPELLEFLTNHFITTGFDIKETLRAIFRSETYQRQAGIRSQDGAELYHFQGPLLRRMSAEQIWDSLLTMAVYNPDGFTRPSLNSLKQLEVDLKSVDAQTILDRAGMFDKQFSIGAMNRADRSHAYKGMTLARASELPLPLPASHFLRQFGQSDRELIAGDHTDGSVTQLLTMFNGPITHMMLEEGSVIYDNVVAQAGLKQRIDLIFMSILNRLPTQEDYTTARAEISANGNAGFGNVIWALINTKEFLFIQ